MSEMVSPGEMEATFHQLVAALTGACGTRGEAFVAQIVDSRTMGVQQERQVIILFFVV
jgi:hypothetical protein